MSEGLAEYLVQPVTALVERVRQAVAARTGYDNNNSSNNPSNNTNNSGSPQNLQNNDKNLQWRDVRPGSPYLENL